MATDRPDVWFPVVVGDYLKDTSRLTTEQHGAYLLMLFDYWVKGPLPDDDRALAAITGLSARAWKCNRPTLVRYFRVEDGQWRHKRVDEELERWAEKKRLYAERAAAGGRAKAASSKSQAGKNGPKSLLETCTSSASTEVGSPKRLPTLSGQNLFNGPREVRQAFVDAKGEDWTGSYIDPCGWQDVPDRALIPRTQVAGRKILGEARAVLARLGLQLLERAA